MTVVAAKPPVVPRGFMSFTLTNGAVLYLGNGIGTQTVPTKAASGGKIETDPTCFLVNGIPCAVDLVDGTKRFANKGLPGSVSWGAEVNGHEIRHAIIQIVSVAGGGSTGIGCARHNDGDTYVPDANHGFSLSLGSIVEIWNSRGAIFNFALINLSGQNMIVEVLVEE